MASVIKTVGIIGVEGYPIEVQVKVIAGPTAMTIVGLGDQAVKEAKERIEAAFDQIDCVFPKKKIIVNLSPSDIKKSGTYFDLPMIIGLMLESEQLSPRDNNMDEIVFLGEVGLTGELGHFRGVIPMVIEAMRRGYKKVVLPMESFSEASKVEGIQVFAFQTLKQVVMWLEKRMVYEPPNPVKTESRALKSRLDFADVKGHGALMHYVMAAAAGAHNMLLIGPPGCGKSMIAKRIPSILPDLTEEEAIEVLAIHSVAGSTVHNNNHENFRPFRSPHYNTSPNAIIGGGINAMPGEISLAHNGVLFLDELPEFSRQTVDALRQPLEDRIVTVARVRQTNTFPANFMLIAAMNPCKCGYYGSNNCKCSPNEVRKYRQRISGPIYDRMDIQKYMSKVDFMADSLESSSLSSTDMKNKVIAARNIQTKRFKGLSGIRANSQMDTQLTGQFCKLNSECQSYLNSAYEKMPFSARSYNKILNLARTFADLDAAENLRLTDIIAALMGRDLEKEEMLNIGI